MSADIKTRLLDAAQGFVQTQGFHGFSYHDLSRKVGITTASIHYHFPAKADLGEALVRRYRDAVNQAMADIAASAVPLRRKLERVAALFQDTLDTDRRACVCGALAGEFHGLPEPVRAELGRLIEDGIRGIERILATGKASGELPRGNDPAALARLWYCSLQGSLSLARASRPQLLPETIAGLLRATLKP